MTGTNNHLYYMNMIAVDTCRVMTLLKLKESFYNSLPFVTITSYKHNAALKLIT